MSKKALGIIIIALVFIFPFRWVYLEYPPATMVNKTMVDNGRIEYVLFFLAVVIGFLTFMFMSTGSSKADEK
jgi:hypothetical protein